MFHDRCSLFVVQCVAHMNRWTVGSLDENCCRVPTVTGVDALGVIRLRIAFADGRSEERLLPPGTYLIGRESADIVLNDPDVAVAHAQFGPEPARRAAQPSTRGGNRTLTLPFLRRPSLPVGVLGQTSQSPPRESNSDLNWSWASRLCHLG